jgi:hypothetical protein
VAANGSGKQGGQCGCEWTEQDFSDTIRAEVEFNLFEQITDTKQCNAGARAKRSSGIIERTEFSFPTNYSGKNLELN